MPFIMFLLALIVFVLLGWGIAALIGIVLWKGIALAAIIYLIASN